MSSSSSTTRIRSPSFTPYSYSAAGLKPPLSDEDVPVARILIVEPHPDIRTLFAHVVRRAGHEPVLAVEDGGLAVGAAVIEPGDDEGLLCARRLRALGLPLVFASIFPADRATLELEPVAYFVKPFALAKLEQALELALAQAKAA